VTVSVDSAVDSAHLNHIAVNLHGTVK